MSVSARLTAALRNAQALAANGDLPGARDLVAQEIRTASRGLGRDHPEVLAAQRVLADLHLRLNEPGLASAVLAEAMGTGAFRLGKSHPTMVGIAGDLAAITTAGTGWTGADESCGPGMGGVEDPRFEHPRPEPPPLGYPPIFDPQESGFEEDTGSSGRIGLVVAAVIAGVTLLGGGTVAAVMATGSDGSASAAMAPSPTGSAPSTGAVPSLAVPSIEAPSVAPSGAPRDLMVLDSGTSVRLSWSAPAVRPVNYTVAAGQGPRLAPLHQTTATQDTVEGLVPGKEYCFTVTAVYDSGWTATSAPACTKRT